jgi:predicted DCC family thiol-disulfide oxidoreductase YuxK
MPSKPMLIYDGRCSFCRIWVDYYRGLTGTAVDYAPSQEVACNFPQIPAESFRQAVQMVLPDGTVLSGAAAALSTLEFGDVRWPMWLYRHAPGVAPASELIYSFIAERRNNFSALTRLTFGRPEALSYDRVQWLFLRALALIYFIAFTSLAVQITGLVGAQGLLPAGRFLAGAREGLGSRAFWEIPGVLWIAHSDAVLRGAAWTGAALSLVLLIGRAERAVLVCLYVLYLSLTTIGQSFLAFQWDMLLLEAGFLAIFLSGSKWIIFLFRWLLFRLMFLSGFAKIASHDPTWRDLTAMSYHYLTQPLPTPLAWFMYQLPLGFQRLSTAFVLLTELAVPFLILGPRVWRRVAFFPLVALQCLIFLTGNYTFFNLLTIALCLFLLDDAMLARLPLKTRAARTNPALAKAVAAMILLVSAAELWGVFTRRASPLDVITEKIAPFGIANTYGLFANMTTERPEIVVQGSNDGREWLDYEFLYKPGDLAKAPRWVAPYQPCLDWQMWFAALSGYRSEPWFVNFMLRLLQSSPPVEALLAKNPFPAAPPKYVRALLYDYSFTDWRERRETGYWWKRRARGIYLRAISLDDFRIAPERSSN